MTNYHLDLKTSLQLRLSQRMQQSIKLLQMSNQELCEFVATLVETNPLLEYEEQSIAVKEDDGNSSYDDDFFHDQWRDNYENVWQDEGIQHAKIPPSSNQKDDYDPFYHVAASVDLKGYLLEQISLKIPKFLQSISQAFLQLIDDAGYLPENYLQELGFQGFSRDMMDRTLPLLQALEPVGVFARNLEECLILQLKDRGTYCESIEAFLNALKSEKTPALLRKKLGMSQDDCQEYLRILRTLNPKPGLSVGESIAPQVIPDIVMRRKGAYDWVIELNPISLPQVYLNSSYFIELKRLMRNLNDKTYLSEKYSEGKWLLKSLHQRTVNILKVADLIVRKQAGFLKFQEGTLLPLTLKEIASETGLSESTVSRVTTDKYIETPRGVFEMKSFFSAQVGDAASSQSAHSIQQAIRKVIQEEDLLHPLSDSDIAERLKFLGILVARRTITKYREILKIDNVTDRKKYHAWSQHPLQKDGKILGLGS